LKEFPTNCPVSATIAFVTLTVKSFNHFLYTDQSVPPFHVKIRGITKHVDHAARNMGVNPACGV
jgi:hypothetical protein